MMMLLSKGPLRLFLPCLSVFAAVSSKQACPCLSCVCNLGFLTFMVAVLLFDCFCATFCFPATVYIPPAKFP